MKFKLPIEAIIDAADETQAQMHARTIAKMLSQATVKFALKTQGVTLLSTTVGTPEEKR